VFGAHRREEFGVGRGPSKKDAEQEAARQALETLGVVVWPA
jgi:dsRNA-specific ribonuclease